MTRPNVQPPGTMRLADSGRRLQIIVLVIAFLLSLFAGRLLQLQGVNASAYAAQAEEERRRIVTLPASRGDITDVDGVALATTVEARDVTADPSLVTDPAATAAALARLLGGKAAALEAKLRSDGRYVLLARQVSPERARAVLALDVDPDQEGQQLPGIFAIRAHKRVYPSGDLAGSIVGFVGRDGHGLAGMELAAEDRLAGRDGRATYETALGRRLPSGATDAEQPVPGADVRLTIDRDVQWMAQRTIATKVTEVAAESGTVVVMEVDTGRLLALATAPAVDPRRPGDSPAADRGNRSLSEVYEPGSTGKAITAAAVIEEGAAGPRTKFTVPPQLYRGGNEFNDHSPHGTLKMTLAGVLAQSSNLGTILATERLGKRRDEVLHHYLQAFGVGQPTGLDFPGASTGLLPALADWSATTSYTLPFGQGYSVNTVQMASAYAILAAGGVRVQPSVVAGWVAPDGSYTPAPAPQRRRVVSESTADQVSRMLEMVVGEGGTAPNAAIPGYRVAGKTGTANRVDPQTGGYRGYTASFIGYAPADDPAYVVAVTLQDPTRGYYGGQLAGPVFKEVLSFVLASERVPPTGTRPPSMRLEW